MDLITIRLKDLGTDCVVFNADGDAFLDISKCDIVTKGYNDEYELTCITKLTKKETSTGKKMVAVCKTQTEEQRLNKEPLVYIGGGIRLFEDGNSYDGLPVVTPSSKSSQTPPPFKANKPLPM